MSSFLRSTSLLGNPTTHYESADTDSWTSLPVLIQGKKAILRFTQTRFEVKRDDDKRGPLAKLFTAIFGLVSSYLGHPDPSNLHTSLQNVLWAGLDGKQLRLATTAKKGGHMRLVIVDAYLQDVTDNMVNAKDWAEQLMEHAYPHATRKRKFLVLINPAGGKGKARGIYESSVRPVLQAAHCTFEAIYTTHCGHAQQIAAELPLEYDAILTVSGDGLPYEIINGFSQRPDALAAFDAVAITPIPAGSGNGFSLNLIGAEKCFDPVMMTLNAVKGVPMRMDLCSVTSMETRRTVYSFLGQAAGLMAELDLGTESLRWMGDTRFVLGFLKGAWNNTPRHLRIAIRNPDADKGAMLKAFLQGAAVDDSLPPDTSSKPSLSPKFVHEAEIDEGWQNFEHPILYAYGGLMPYVGRDLMDFPLKRPCDGKIHLVVQELETRAAMVNMIDGASDGDPYFLGTHHYYQTQAYRVTPTKPTSKERSCFSIDGERHSYEGIHVEVHKGVWKTFSMENGFVIPATFGMGPKAKLL